MNAFPATFGRGRPMTGKRRRRRRIAGRTVLYVIAWLVAILTLVPLIYAVLGGFRTTAQIAADPIALPSPWVLSNYTDLLQSSTFLRELFNSALIALVSTILVVPLAAFAAYVFARFAFRGRELFYTLFTLGLLWVFEILEGTSLAPGKAAARLGSGIGQITRVAGATNLELPAVAALANEIQRFLVQETRLGIPAIVHEECLHGFLARGAVCYPQSIGMAAAWDPELVETIARGMAHQMRSAGAHQALSPIFDVARDPRWGRIEETYGEDPYLVAALGVAYVRGLQEGD